MRYEILQDDCIESPREWDNIGKMCCAHKRYTLGDEQVSSNYANSWEEEMAYYFADNVEVSDEIWSWGFDECPEDYARIWKWIDKNIVWLPLYLYDHSGVTMNTTGFSCGWDSGQVGWIFVSKEDIRKEYGVKRISKKLKDRVLEILYYEVETYDQYLTGEVYMYNIYDDNEEFVDNCGGFYSKEEAEEEAKQNI